MPIEELADQSFESILPQEKPAKKKKNLPVLLIGGGFLTALVLLVILAKFLSKPTPELSPPLKPTSTPPPSEEKVVPPSAYSTDSAILRIEGELEILEEKLQSTDLREVNLNPPVLNMDINFEE